jgi:transposase
VQERIAVYEQEILRKLGEMERKEPHEPTAASLQNANKARTIKNRGQEAKRQALYRMSGVDMTQIDAIGVETVEVVVSEYGSDLSHFSTEKQFVSHITLAPRVPKSGGQPVRKKKRNSASTRVAAALRMARSPCATARRPWKRTIEKSRNAAAETLPYSLPSGSWLALSTGCCDGASRTWTKAQPHTKTGIASTASDVWPPQPKNSDIN